jgi:hypothetical protein
MRMHILAAQSRRLGPRPPVVSPARVAVGTYAGTGSAQSINLGFRPDLVIVKGGSRSACYQGRLGWHDRSGYLDAIDSDYLISLNADGFAVTTAADANENGATFHYLAIADQGAGLLQQTAWMGNQTDSRIVQFTERAEIKLAIVKRDSVRDPVLRHSGMAANVSMLTTGGTGTYVRAFGNGALTIDGSNYTNELNGSLQRGEGIEGFAFCDAPGLALVHWTGDGTTDRQIAAGFAPVWCLLIRNDGSAPLPEIVATTMAAGASAPLSAAAFNSGRVDALTATGLTLGDTTWNASGVSYSALFLAAATGDAPAIPAPTGNYLALAGTTSSVQFGDAAALDVGGEGNAFSLEWHGRRNASGVHTPLFVRGNSTQSGTHASNAGEYSWGLSVYQPVDGFGHGWVGDVFRIIHGNYMAVTLSESNTTYYSWCTGIVAPIDDMHVVVTHNGSGLWRLYLNGQLVKQREINMNSFGSRANSGSGTHDAVIGARLSAADALLDSRSIRLYGARVYDSELTREQARTRYRIAVLQEAATDVTPLEEWACTDGSGAVLSATNDPALDGTIVGGTWGAR